VFAATPLENPVLPTGVHSEVVSAAAGPASKTSSRGRTITHPDHFLKNEFINLASLKIIIFYFLQTVLYIITSATEAFEKEININQ